MLLDELLPAYDFHEVHEITIAAPIANVWDALHTVDLNDSWIIRFLMALRGMPRLLASRAHRTPQERPKLTLATAIRGGFLPLGERPPQEVVLGLVGQFWRPTGGLRPNLSPGEFVDFALPGYAKTAWNFALVPVGPSQTRVVTETRILCLDPIARRRFRLYWLLISAFSGWIRMEMLRGLKRTAESPSPA